MQNSTIIEQYFGIKNDSLVLGIECAAYGKYLSEPNEVLIVVNGIYRKLKQTVLGILQQETQI